jgi:rhomboid family GlyGly-CTERM serine protease
VGTEDSTKVLQLIVKRSVFPKAEATLIARLRRWPILVAAAAAGVLLQIGGAPVATWARYEPGAFAHFELWRLLTAHLVHLSWAHLAMNLAALGLIELLFEDVLGTLEWGCAVIVSAVAIDTGLYLFDPEVRWYVGLSGVLHGLVACGTWELLRRRSGVGALLAIGLSAKLMWEQWWGPVPLTASSVGGPVVVAAHLYGAAGGTFIGVAFTVGRRWFGTERR